MGPAGPTVLRDVLVPSGAGEVDTVHVPPVPALGQRGDVQVLVRAGVGPARRQKQQLVPLLLLPVFSGKLQDCFFERQFSKSFVTASGQKSMARHVTTGSVTGPCAVS